MSNSTTSKGGRPRIIRKLGPFECFQTALYVLDLFCGTSVTCRYSIQDNLREPAAHSKLVDVIEIAVADTINQHPLLQVGLINEGTTRPAWVRLDHVDLSQHIEWRIVEHREKYEEIRNEVLLRQLDTKFENLATQPGWRLAILEPEYESLLEIMFVWNHSNTDGTGGKIFHQTLLQSLNNLADKPDLVALDNHICKITAPAENMVPPQDAIANFQITPGYAAATLWAELKLPIWKPKYSYASWAPITLTPRQTQIRSLSIGNGLLQKVLSVCRSHNTTLTACLHGIAFMSLAPQLPEQKVATMVGETPFNLRRFVKSNPPGYSWIEPSTMIGNYVAKMHHEFDKSLVHKVRELSQGATEKERFAALEDEMWAAAVTVRGELKEKLDLGLKNDKVGLMGIVGDWQKYQRDRMKQPRVGSWMVTNVGVIDGQSKTDQGWSIQGSNFALSANVLSAMFVLSTIAVKGGELCVGVSWQDHIVEASIGERLVADVGGWLSYIGSRA